LIDSFSPNLNEPNELQEHIEAIFGYLSIGLIKKSKTQLY
jgi:hypothetical protein